MVNFGANYVKQEAITLANRMIGRMVKSPVPWANLGAISHLIADSIPTKHPPILIVSTPRSGSSWVGDTLGLSKSSLYLREPITQTYLGKRRSGASFFEIKANNIPKTYKLAGDLAFAGLPKFPRRIVRYRRQWSILGRSNKRLVIKEINPFAIGWIIDAYKPRIIYLIRHPAAVANSFFAKGWTKVEIESRFSAETLETKDYNFEKFAPSFWAQHGALQALMLNESISILKNYPDHKIVRYEDLCLQPKAVFTELYRFCELSWGREVEAEIDLRSTATKAYTPGGVGVQRNSSDMAQKWKTEMSTAQIEQVKEAYLAYNPPYYNSQEW